MADRAVHIELVPDTALSHSCEQLFVRRIDDRWLRFPDRSRCFYKPDLEPHKAGNVQD